MSELIDIPKYSIIHNKAFLQPAPISYFSWILQNGKHALLCNTFSNKIWRKNKCVVCYSLSILYPFLNISMNILIVRRHFAAAKKKSRKGGGGGELDTPKKRASILNIDFDRTSSEWTNVGYKYYYVQKYFYYVVI